MDNNVVISFEGTQKFLGEEAQTINMVTDGRLLSDQGRLLLSYDESDLTGIEGTETIFSIEGEHVEMTRRGALKSRMVFEKGMRDISLYDMGFGAMTIEVNTRRLKNELTPAGGKLEISYGIEIEKRIRGLNTFRIDVRPRGEAIPQ